MPATSQPSADAGRGERLTSLRRKTLEHIQAVNEASGSGARCPYGEMIEEAEASIRDGQSEWRDVPYGAGRWLTDAGREALSKEKDHG
ncbi:hypothetical protein [Methylobacterium sp. WL7]|uniref:hypothetical protein n=1 Tax=Methylobacterium sp. WL7 TaxID=2603900 RepID=UPI0011C77C9A|nr:hypothetical protein [Methylobacterium sp. WL7]TXN43570.1 hypothetical protein FV233_17895 [Methylobacterium sp. WL7]